jgi:hypothetical protein
MQLIYKNKHKKCLRPVDVVTDKVAYIYSDPSPDNAADCTSNPEPVAMVHSGSYPGSDCAKN